jgi:hypothetical protein
MWGGSCVDASTAVTMAGMVAALPCQDRVCAHMPHFPGAQSHSRTVAQSQGISKRGTAQVPSHEFPIKVYGLPVQCSAQKTGDASINYRGGKMLFRRRLQSCDVLLSLMAALEGGQSATASSVRISHHHPCRERRIFPFGRR